MTTQNEGTAITTHSLQDELAEEKKVGSQEKPAAIAGEDESAKDMEGHLPKGMAEKVETVNPNTMEVNR